MNPIRIPSASSKALFLLLAAGVAACDTGTGPVNGGRVRLTLSAGDPLVAAPQATAPATTGDWEGERDRPIFQSANVTFASVLARNVDGELVDLGMDLPTTVDIIAMEEGGRTVTLPDGELPPATYDQIVVVMTAVEGVLNDGTTITVTPPGGGWTAIVPVCPFDVVEGETAVVGLTLPVRSALYLREGRFHFAPRFRSYVRCDAPPEEPTDGTPDAGGDGDGAA